MIWSKLQKKVESLMADLVKERLQVHLTRYGSGDTFIMNRAWVTWDGQEISTFSTIKWMNERKILTAQMSGDGELRADYCKYFAQAEKLLEEREIYPCEYFLGALETYASLSIENALNSSDVLIRAWSMFDERLGKRRLRTLSFKQDKLKYERLWYQFRCEAEKIVIPEIH